MIKGIHVMPGTCPALRMLRPLAPLKRNGSVTAQKRRGRIANAPGSAPTTSEQKPTGIHEDDPPEVSMSRCVGHTHPVCQSDSGPNNFLSASTVSAEAQMQAPSYLSA